MEKWAEEGKKAKIKLVFSLLYILLKGAVEHGDANQITLERPRVVILQPDIMTLDGYLYLHYLNGLCTSMLHPRHTKLESQAGAGPKYAFQSSLEGSLCT